MAAQPYGVDSHIRYRLACGFDIRRDVLVHQSSALEHHVRADVAELVDQASAADHSAIFNNHFASELGSIADYHAIADNTVMGYMGIGHYQTVVADNCSALGSCATVDCDAFAKGGAVADNCRGFFAFELKVLRDGTYHSSREDMHITAYTGTVENGHVILDTAAVTYLDVAMNYRKGANLHIFAYPGVGMHIC